MRGRAPWRDGPETFTGAAEQAARRAGVTIRTGAEVTHVEVRDDAVTAVVLANGDTIPARRVLSTASPARTLLEWIDPVWLDPEFLRAAKNIRYRGCTSFVLYALDGPHLQQFVQGGGRAVGVEPAAGARCVEIVGRGAAVSQRFQLRRLERLRDHRRGSRHHRVPRRQLRERRIEIRKVDVAEQEAPVEPARFHSSDAGPAEGIHHQLFRRRALCNQRPDHCAGLHRRSRDARAGSHQHVRNAQIVERALPLLEEEDPLVRGPVVIPGPAADAAAVQRGLRPDDLFPVREAARALPRAVEEPCGADALLLLDDVGRHLVAEEVEVPVRPKHAVHLAEKLRQPLIGHRGEPVGSQTGGGASGAMDLQRLVRRVGDHEVYRLGREAAQQVEGVGNDHATALGRRRGGERKLEQVGFAHADNLPEPSDTAFSMA